MSGKRILIVCRQAPYGSSHAREGLELALAASVFEQQLALLFIGEGIWQLHKDQRPYNIQQKSLEKLLSAFPLYDIDQLYAASSALAERQLTKTQLSVTVKELTDEAIADFIAGFDVVLNF